MFIYILDNDNLNNDEIINLFFFKKYIENSDKSLVEIYESDIINNRYITDLRKKELEQLYLLGKRRLNVLKNMIRRIKWNRSKIYDMDTDLYLNPLTEFKDKFKIELLINKTRYNFRLSDIVNNMMTGLLHNEELFSEPMALKNPFTNVEIKRHNLYNIYFKLVETGFTIPTLITSYYLNNFSMDDFYREQCCKLKDLTIKRYYEKCNTYDKYDELLNMLYEHRHSIDNLMLKENITFFQKKVAISKIETELNDYFISKYTYNLFEKRKLTQKVKTSLRVKYLKNPFMDMPSAIIINNRRRNIYELSGNQITRRRRNAIIPPPLRQPPPPPESPPINLTDTPEQPLLVNTDSYDDILTGDETDISYSLLTNRILENAINNTITMLNQSEDSVVNNIERYSIPNETRIPRPRNPPDLRNIGNTSSLPNISTQMTPTTNNTSANSNITSTTSRLTRTTSNILNMNRTRRSLDRTRYPILRSNTNGSINQTSTRTTQTTQTTQTQPAIGRISNVNISNIRYQNNFRLFNN